MNNELAQIALIAGVIISIGGALEVLRRLLRNIWRAYIVTRDGLLHLAEVREVVVRELMPNGGGSLVDHVHRIDKRLERIEQEHRDA